MGQVLRKGGDAKPTGGILRRVWRNLSLSVYLSLYLMNCLGISRAQTCVQVDGE